MLMAYGSEMELEINEETTMANVGRNTGWIYTGIYH